MSAEHSGEDPAFPWTFDLKLRCCTFHPFVANYLLGRALREGEGPEAAIRQRLQQREGVTSHGIYATDAYNERYDSMGAGHFGRDASLLCPYFVAADGACGIWSNRPSVCRTWSCRYQHAVVGYERARAAHDVLLCVENILGLCCVALGTPPGLTADAEDWLRWFRWCADQVDRLEPSRLAAIADTGGLGAARQELRRLLYATYGELPEVVIPSVCQVRNVDERVRISGYHSYDAAWMPRAVYHFFSLLDGRKTWGQALAELPPIEGAPFTEAHVQQLWRVSALRSPQPGDVRGDGRENDAFVVNELGFSDGRFLVGYDPNRINRPS